MKRLFIAALVVVAVGAVAGTALAGVKSGVIYDSTNSNGGPTNLVSYGPTAYGFSTIGDQITFKNGTARSLNNVTVTMSSWACQQGSWNGQNCVTQSGATFSQPITLTIWNTDHAIQLATSTKTFDIPFRPSASPKCPDGKWLTPAKLCKNGLANDVTFNFSNVTLPDTVVYEISYPTGGPADSLNVAITDAPSVGTTTDGIWTDGAFNLDFDGGWATDNHVTPAVQFKAGNAS